MPAWQGSFSMASARQNSPPSSGVADEVQVVHRLEEIGDEVLAADAPAGRRRGGAADGRRMAG